MKIINVCGYGNTGCTSQADLLCDHEGVFGVLSPLGHTRGDKTAYHEIGVLKCVYSFGGLLLAKLRNAPDIPTKTQIELSLCGIDPKPPVPLNFGQGLHLKNRDLLNSQYGDRYKDVVKSSMQLIPDDLTDITALDLFPHIKASMKCWIEGLVEITQSTPSLAVRDGEAAEVLGLKNDPPGAFPLLAAVIPNGITSAILREPKDTTYDFNRHYKLGHTDQTVKNHCAHYNAQLNSGRSQLERFPELIADTYFVHEFEQLVGSEQQRENYAVKMIGGRKKVRSNFDPAKSAINIGHHVNLSSEHLDYIDEQCTEKYLSYKAFLVEKGLMLEPVSL